MKYNCSTKQHSTKPPHTHLLVLREKYNSTCRALVNKSGLGPRVEAPHALEILQRCVQYP